MNLERPAYPRVSAIGTLQTLMATLSIGWSARGDRPEFGLVTGVSTGALSAPFAFLGPEYDAKLKQVYTDTSAGDIFNKRSLIAAKAPG